MTVKKEKYNLAYKFLKSVDKYPERTALEVECCKYTYKELASISARIGKKVSEHNNNNYVGILCQRSIAAYSSVIGVLSAGYAYMPLHPDTPINRSLMMLNVSNIQLMIIGKECQKTFNEILDAVNTNMTFILVDYDNVKEIVEQHPEHKFVFIESSKAIETELYINEVNEEQFSYLLFTSGSTGVPKGVPVKHKNINAYINYISEQYSFDEYDKFSQMFELVFDPSIHDMFVCWNVGACLCVPNSSQMLLPVSYIQESNITVWFSVPSVVMLIEQYGRLKEKIFTTIKQSFFSGEALPEQIAYKWSLSAPNSIINNLYGPTETTITITSYNYSKNSNYLSDNGLVPIGYVYDTQEALIIDDDNNVVASGMAGELCLSGSQITKGYLNNTEQTEKNFIRLKKDTSDLWYKTGDIVKRDEKNCLYYIGRIDNQVKINGNRIELNEIDMVVRNVSQSEMVASIAWPYKNDVAVGIVSIICKMKEIEKEEVLEYCKSKLPQVMVPKKIYFIEKMPLNINGKVDRNKLREMLVNGIL